MAFHGVTIEVVLERLAAEGKIDKEYIGTLDGGAADIDFPVKRFPITTSVGVTTDDETLVDVFTDDLTPGSWSEYADDGSDFTIVGATGVVTVKAAENQPGNSGERISISYYTTMTPGRGQSFEVGVRREVIEVWELGSADPQDLVAGKKSLSMSLDDLYINAAMFGWVIGESDFYKLPSDCSVYIYPNGNQVGQPYVKLANVMFEGGVFTGSIDSLLGIGFTMKGLAVSVGTVS